MIKFSTFRNKYVHNFIRHNKNIFKKSNSEENIVLTEFNGWPITHIAISNCLLALENNYTFKKIAYSENSFKKFLKKKNFYEKSKFILGKFFNLRTFGIYKSFGINDFLSIDYDKTLENNSKIILKKILGELKFKRDVLKIKINKIPIGDLIYDSYLKEYNQPTIEIKSNSFEEYLHAAIQYFLIWEKFFKTKKVLGVLSSHSVYMSSIPSRIGIYYNSICLVCNAEKLYRLSKKNKESDKEFLFFNKTKKKINKKELRVGLSIAAKRLDSRFNGKIGVDMSYLTKTAYGKNSAKKILKDSEKIKVLIAPHAFSDAPHTLGNHLLPDYYEWLNFVLINLNKEKYDCYIKCHPNFVDYFDRTIEYVKEFQRKYPFLNYIQPEISHKQLIHEGINVVITCHGSIGGEYPYFNIPVVNASINNPHIDYKFNLHPKNITNLKKILNSLDKINIKINKKEILEYYFFKNIFYSNNWLFEDFSKLINYVGNFKKIHKDSKTYQYWLINWNLKKQKNITKSINDFINSDDYILTYKNKNILFSEHLKRLWKK